MDSLEDFSPRECDGYAEITFPVVMHMACTLLELRITPYEDYYRICCPDDLFYDANGPQSRYFDIFMNNDKNYHYKMKIDDDCIIYKDYENDFNPSCALDEFIRFFILFDDFIRRNDVIGHEEDFE